MYRVFDSRSLQYSTRMQIECLLVCMHCHQQHLLHVQRPKERRTNNRIIILLVYLHFALSFSAQLIFTHKKSQLPICENIKSTEKDLAPII